jgi:hypothetical protein
MGRQESDSDAIDPTAVEPMIGVVVNLAAAIGGERQ